MVVLGNLDGFLVQTYVMQYNEQISTRFFVGNSDQTKTTEFVLRIYLNMTINPSPEPMIVDI